MGELQLFAFNGAANISIWWKDGAYGKLQRPSHNNICSHIAWAVPLLKAKILFSQDIIHKTLSGPFNFHSLYIYTLYRTKNLPKRPFLDELIMVI